MDYDLSRGVAQAPPLAEPQRGSLIADIRHRNFMALFASWQDKHPQLAGFGALKKFGEAIGITQRQISHIKTRQREIGHQTARRIEQALGLPHGYMDVGHPGPLPAEPESVSAPSEDQAMQMFAAALRIDRSLALKGLMQIYDEALSGLRDEADAKSRNG